MEAPEGTAHVTINSDEDGPAEVFVAVGRAGSDITALAEAIGRLISFSLRLASPMSQLERLGQIQRQLDNIGGSRSKGFGPHKILSVPHAIAHAIGKFTERATLETKYGIEGVKEIERVLTNPDKQAPLEKNGQQESLEALKEGLKGLKPQDNACPMCMNFGTYVKEEGCSKCHSCGYSEC